MSKTTISFRTEKDRMTALDKLADHQDRNRSFLINEALDQYIAVQQWHIDHIKRGLEQADQGEFVAPDEIQETFAKLRARC